MNGSSTNETHWCMSEYPNLALHKPAWQSSDNNNRAAKRAVDGNRDGYLLRGGCNLTEVEEVPWWVVDLQARFKIVRVAITNRRSLGKFTSRFL